MNTIAIEHLRASADAKRGVLQQMRSQLARDEEQLVKLRSAIDLIEIEAERLECAANLLSTVRPPARGGIVINVSGPADQQVADAVARALTRKG